MMGELSGCLTLGNAYSAEKGFGWTSVQGEYPLDPFQPDVLYRSVINVAKGYFTVDLPNGKYRVFMNIDGQAGYWGDVQHYRSRRVVANGKEVVNESMDKEKALKKYFRNAEVEDLYEDNIFDKYVTPFYNEKQFEHHVNSEMSR